MSRVSIQFYLLAALCVVSSLSFCLAEDEEWRQYHDQLYATDGFGVGLEKTVELLHKLHDLYEGKTDEATQKRSERIEALLSLEKVDEENCNDEYVTKVDKLIDLMWSYPKNLLPYVKYQRQRQFDECQIYFASRLEVAVLTLSPKEREEIDSLVKHIDDGEESKYYCDEKHNKVGAGVVSYLESKDQSFLDGLLKSAGNLDRTKVYEKVKDAVQPLCERVWKTVEGPLAHYDKFDSTEESKKRRDEQVAKWYHSQRVCRYILYHMEDVMEESYKAIKHTGGLSGSGLKTKLMKMIKS